MLKYMGLSVLGALAVCGAHAATWAATLTPHAIVAALYRPYLADPHAQNPAPVSAVDLIRPYADAELAKAIDADNACMERTGDVCALDVDILIDGQDWDISKFRIADAPVSHDRKTVRACFDNDGPRCVSFFFVRAAGGWKIHDVAAAAIAPDGRPQTQWRLKATLERG